MSYYYTTHPNLSVTALIDAPSTEKARTTFLDYLERRNLISRADRQYWRKNMITKRMEDPRDLQADVELNYGYQEGGQQMPPSMAATPSSSRYLEEGREPWSEDYLGEGDELVDEFMERPNPDVEPSEHKEPDVYQTEPTPAPKLSPIAQVALGRRD